MKYDYKCTTCSNVYEIERGMTEPEEFPICVTCRTNMVRDYTAPTIVFNAPGFYVTDNKR